MVPISEAPLVIRPMNQHEMALALEWANAEGWNPGLHDAEPFHLADPQGFMIALIGEEPVSIISATRYGANYGFIGSYIVRPDLRGQGFGIAIWRTAIAHLEGRLIGLDGVLAQQANYRKSGFVLAHRNIRFEGKVQAAASAVPPRGLVIRPVSEVSHAALLAYDRTFFPAARERFLDAWISRPGTVALTLCRGETPVGYGVARPCRVGWKIAPLFCDTLDGAETLFRALNAHLPEGAPVYLDVPETQIEAVGLALRYGMQPMFETARMYTGAAPSISLERTYGLTSFELG